MILTVNSNGTFNMVDNIEDYQSSGTWSFSAGTLTVVVGGKPEVYKIEEASATSFTWGEIDVKGTERSYSRMTWTKK
jgi:hypothetical protein